MMETNKRVLVTGIGGNVGQGVLMNLSASFSGLSIYGTDTNKVSAGLYFCDNFLHVPLAKDAEFINVVRDYIDSQKIDLVIPTTDDEVLALSKSSKIEGSCAVLTSPYESCKVFYDKWESFLAFRNLKIPFAASWLPSQWQSNFDKYIVKPRTGRGSRDIFICPESVGTFSDDYIVQEYLDGKELSVSFYVDRSGNLVDFIVFERELTHGMTSRCQVVKDYNLEVEKIVKEIVSNFTIHGPCNVQARATPKGIIIFEVNCRYSGTNSIRSEFGFPDVFWGADEYLFNHIPKKGLITKGSALRFYSDIIYPNINLDQILPRNKKAFIKP